MCLTPGTKQDSRPCAQPRRLRNIRKMRHPLIFIAVLLAPDAVAGWTPLGTDGSPEFGYYIDSGAIRQTGPMAIYRQVRVLRQWQAAAASAETTVSVHEYDCMAGRFRTLRVDRFDQPWAEGEAVSLPVPASSSAWQELPTDVLGRPLFDTLCPSGEGD